MSIWATNSEIETVLEDQQAPWTDGFWWSGDGLRLHYRDYPGPADRPPLLCLPGLTRNARDFEGLAARLAGQWRVIAVDLRGRGESAYARDPLSYVPLTYLQDIKALLDELQLPRVVAVGTSLGGLLAMLIGAADPGRLAGVVLNDIGPDIEATGLARIRGHVGVSRNWPTWIHAARDLAADNAAAFPDYRLEDWLIFAKRLCRLTPAGRVVLDYDMKIAEPFRLPGGENGVDLWPALDALKNLPTLLVRGALSDILSARTAARMRRHLPHMHYCELPRTGHAPTLEEPQAAAAIDALLDELLLANGG